jgi:hypothetical protein
MVDWGEFEMHWKNNGCTKNDLWGYINHPNVKAIFTTTHQNAIKSPHPKVKPIPLGISEGQAKVVGEKLHAGMLNCTKLLTINFNPLGTRQPIADSVIANFNGTVKNTYKIADYWKELQESKFVLCPSGLGWDTYRSWEALILGAFPVLETYYRTDGFYQAYDELPVLWVDHYDNVTPALLEEAYPKILSRAREYKFEKLTRQWWIDYINSFRPSRQRHASDVECKVVPR